MTCSSCLEGVCICWGVGSDADDDIMHQVLLMCFPVVFQEFAAGLDVGQAWRQQGLSWDRDDADLYCFNK